MIRRRLVLLFACCFLFAGTVLRAEDQFFDSKGVKIRYTVQGQGEPVLLIHGFTGNLERQWGAIPADLAKDYKVIAIDNRDLTSESTHRLGQLYSDVAAADHEKVFGHLVQFQCLDMREGFRFKKTGDRF